MQLEVSPVRGFQDYLPSLSLKREKIRRIVQNNFKLFGFLPIETPAIEFDELMRSDSISDEEDIISERFKLKDKSGRNLGLRYDLSLQLSRVLKENLGIKLPFMCYQIGNVFRDTTVKTGRTKQFCQCSVEIIGDESINADIECVAAISSVFEKLGINTEIMINNKKLLGSIIESVQIDDKKQVMKELDKVEKLGLDIVKANLRRYASANQIITLFRIFEKNLGFFKENAFDGANEVEELIKLCKLYSIDAKFNPLLINGLNYYTGNIFEARLKDKNIGIAGGGRYDNSLGRYLGKKMPAVGFSFSLEALTEICEPQIAKLKIEKFPTIVLISEKKDSETIKLLKRMRKNNISCLAKFGKNLEPLDLNEIPFSLQINKEDLAKGKFKLKDNKTGEEKLLTEKQLINKFGK